MSCTCCEGFSEPRKLIQPYEYRDLARRLMQVVDQGNLILIKAACPLRELLGPVWPGDLLEHIFECAGCGGKFRLHADTWYGSVLWEPIRDAEPA